MEYKLVRFNVALQTWLHGGGRVIQSKSKGKLFKVRAIKFEPKILLVVYDGANIIEREPDYFIYPTLLETEAMENLESSHTAACNHELTDAGIKQARPFKCIGYFKIISNKARGLFV